MKNGKIAKVEVVRHVPYLPYTFADVTWERGVPNTNELADAVAEVLPGNEEKTAMVETMHCFVIPDSAFELYNKEDLAYAIRLHLDRLDRRRVSMPDRNVGEKKRDDMLVYLRNLGAMRLLHVCDHTRLNTLPDIVPEEVLKKLKLGEPRRYIDYALQVPRIFHHFFKVAKTEFPINWSE